MMKTRANDITGVGSWKLAGFLNIANIGLASYLHCGKNDHHQKTRRRIIITKRTQAATREIQNGFCVRIDPVFILFINPDFHFEPFRLAPIVQHILRPIPPTSLDTGLSDSQSPQLPLWSGMDV